jgi:hypothetical protein
MPFNLSTVEQQADQSVGDDKQQISSSSDASDLVQQIADLQSSRTTAINATKRYRQRYVSAKEELREFKEASLKEVASTIEGEELLYKLFRGLFSKLKTSNNLSDIKSTSETLAYKVSELRFQADSLKDDALELSFDYQKTWQLSVSKFYAAFSTLERRAALAEKTSVTLEKRAVEAEQSSNQRKRDYARLSSEVALQSADRLQSSAAELEAFATRLRSSEEALTSLRCEYATAMAAATVAAPKSLDCVALEELRLDYRTLSDKHRKVNDQLSLIQDTELQRFTRTFESGISLTKLSTKNGSSEYRKPRMHKFYLVSSIGSDDDDAVHRLEWGEKRTKSFVITKATVELGDNSNNNRSGISSFTIFNQQGSTSLRLEADSAIAASEIVRKLRLSILRPFEDDAVDISQVDPRITFSGKGVEGSGESLERESIEDDGI